MRLKSMLLLAIIGITVLSSCEKEDPEIPNEEEVITTLTYTLTPSGGGVPVVMNFQDLDGDGGTAPIISGGTLVANETYDGVLTLQNEQAVPVEDITVEILEEDEDHQFFFQTNVEGLTVTYADQDSNDAPVGLSTQISTSGADNGTLTIILRHLPNKSASGVSNGDISNAGGETDIEVTFDVNVL